MTTKTKAFFVAINDVWYTLLHGLDDDSIEDKDNRVLWSPSGSIKPRMVDQSRITNFLFPPCIFKTNTVSLHIPPISSVSFSLWKKKTTKTFETFGICSLKPGNLKHDIAFLPKWPLRVWWTTRATAEERRPQMVFTVNVIAIAGVSNLFFPPRATLTKSMWSRASLLFYISITVRTGDKSLHHLPSCKLTAQYKHSYKVSSTFMPSVFHSYSLIWYTLLYHQFSQESSKTRILLYQTGMCVFDFIEILTSLIPLVTLLWDLFSFPLETFVL